MKAFKYFSIVAIAALLLAPATAMAKTNFSFSINLFDRLVPMLVPPPPVVITSPPPVYYVPQPVVPRYHNHTIVKEYHYYHHMPQETVTEIQSPVYYYHYPHQN